MGEPVLIILYIVIILIIVATLFFPGLNILTVLNPKKKFFTKASVLGDLLSLEGFGKNERVKISEISSLSMGPLHLRALFNFSGMMSVEIIAGPKKYYVFPGWLNLISPAMKKETIEQMLGVNPTIRLDENLKNYVEKSLADVYINKNQIKKGLILLLLMLLFALLVELRII